jgi:hypothetical protein
MATWKWLECAGNVKQQDKLKQFKIEQQDARRAQHCIPYVKTGGPAKQHQGANMGANLLTKLLAQHVLEGNVRSPMGVRGGAVRGRQVGAGVWRVAIF